MDEDSCHPKNPGFTLQSPAEQTPPKGQGRQYCESVALNNTVGSSGKVSAEYIEDGQGEQESKIEEKLPPEYTSTIIGTEIDWEEPAEMMGEGNDATEEAERDGQVPGGH